MNVTELETLDKNAGVLLPRLLKKAGVVTDSETGEIIRDKRGVVFLNVALPDLRFRLECQCAGEAKNGGEEDEIARARIWFHVAEACCSGDSIPDLWEYTLYLLNPWLPTKALHFANKRLEALKIRNAEERCTQERFANAVATIKPDKLPELIRRCSTDHRDLERRAHKLRYWLAKGKRMTEPAMVVFFAKLTPREREMTDQEFQAEWGLTAKNVTDIGLQVVDSMLPENPKNRRMSSSVTVGSVTDNGSGARSCRKYRKTRRDRIHNSDTERQRAYRQRKRQRSEVTPAEVVAGGTGA